MSKIYCAQPLNKKSKKAFLFDYFEKCAPATFSDPECTNLQCLQRKSRSIGDLKMLLDGAFKTETPVNYLIQMLLSLVDLKGEKHIVRCLFCTNIDKLVFYSSKVHSTYWEYSTNSDENSCLNPKRNSPHDGYSWNSLIEIYKSKQNEQQK